MKRTSYILIILLMMIIFGGCEKDVPIDKYSKDELVMAIGDEPEGGFDPIVGWGRYGSPLFQSTLIETDYNMNIINDLATKYSISEDGLIWLFKLRDNVYFTDGEMLTAEDVVFTFEKAKESGSIVDLTNMESVSLLDEKTIQFRLRKPDLAFIYTVAATGIVPKHAYGPSYAEDPVGSGPFKLVQWDKGQQVVIVANEDYYGDIPAIKKITIVFIGEDAAITAAKSGQLDVTVTTPELANQNIKGMNLVNLKTIDNRGITLPYLKDEGKLNDGGHKVGNNVTSDIAIRRALSYGIDRDKLIIDVVNGYGRPAYSECDDMPWGNEEAIVKYDLEKAMNILDEANWIDTNDDGIRDKNGLEAKFNLIYPASDSTRQAIATAVAIQAERLGIKVNIEGTSWDVIGKNMYSDAVLMGWGAQSPTESYLLYHSDNMGKDFYNPEYFSNSTVDEYIDKAMSTRDIDESMRYWKNVQWDGSTGVSTQGESPWLWLINVDHIYYIREGLDIGKQKIHPHGHSWPLVANLRYWKWN